MQAQLVIEHLMQLGDPIRAQTNLRFFKTAEGEYGAGDHFLGITMPKLRAAVKEHRGLPHSLLLELVRSQWHEIRMFALLVWVYQFERGDEQRQSDIYNAYVEQFVYINNWDLVDCSAPQIIGGYLFSRPRVPLYQWIESDSLWPRRIAILATFYFLRRNDFQDLLNLAAEVLADKEDLIHKASGWMLREMGKRDSALLLDFIRQHYAQMPRTMLRYSIEKLPEPQRKAILRGDVTF